MSYSSLADLVKAFETGGTPDPYTALNYRYDPTHTASGAYQITDTLWQQFAPLAGVDTASYPTAYSAPASAQDATFNAIAGARGLTDWTCPGCNPALSSYIASNPQAASLPISGSGPGAAPSQVSGGAGGASTATGGGGSILNPSTWFSALGAWIAHAAARGGLFVVGLIFILGALALFAVKSGIEIETHAGE